MVGLKSIVEENGYIPLSFVLGSSYANLGDALSPIMVSLLSGKPIRHVDFTSQETRLAAVGTIAHAMQGGQVWVWGTGSSRYSNPLAGPQERRIFEAGKAAEFKVLATRGPVTLAILDKMHAVGQAVYGDPVWLLPRFYPPPARKRWKLGVILHLSELSDRNPSATAQAKYLRYLVETGASDEIRIINTVTDVTVGSMREKLDEILACERIVSTSLHGMVFAESYGIPCLYFLPGRRKAGVETFDLMNEDRINLRLVDLYRGLGLKRLPVYVQDRAARTDWDHLIDAIDRTWEPIEFDTTPLIEAFPLDLDPLTPPPGKTVFDNPVILNTPMTSSGFLSRLKRVLAAVSGA